MEESDRAGSGGRGGREERAWTDGNGGVEEIAVEVRRSGSGGGLGGGHGGSTWWCGGGGGGGGGGWSPSLFFLEQPLERGFPPFFLQMTARVCGGVPSPLIEPLVG